MKLNKKELEVTHWSRDTQGVYKQYNPMKSRWEVRVLGQQMRTRPWCNWTRLLRACSDEGQADQVLTEIRLSGATIWELDSHEQLVVKQ